MDGEPIKIAIPVEERDDIYLASFGLPRFDARENHWINRRFPVEQAQALAGPKLRRIQITSGAAKSYRLPLEVGHVAGDALTFYAVGEREPIAALLSLVGYIGKKRSVGKGAVERWDVDPCEPWGAGFPVVSPEGKPLRPLPIDWPGLVEPEVGYRVMTPPYWMRSREVLCAVPEGMQ